MIIQRLVTIESNFSCSPKIIDTNKAQNDKKGI